MSSHPRVSVVITTYNRADLVVEAIQSVLAQTYTDYELLVADDGSTDDTAERVTAFGNRLRYLPLEHSGRPEDARNAAIKAARGDLIAFLDDDDTWRSDKLACQITAFEQNDALGLVYSDIQLLYPDGSTSPPALKQHQRRPSVVFDHLITDCFIHPSTVVVHRRLFDRIGLFEKRFVSQGDYYFWLRATHAAPARCIPKPLVLVRRHESSLTKQRGIDDYENAIRVLEYLPAAIRLTAKQRILRRRTLARLYTHVGLHVLKTNGVAEARTYFLRSVRYNPLQRRAWTELVGTRAVFGR